MRARKRAARPAAAAAGGGVAGGYFKVLGSHRAMAGKW